MRNPVTDYEFKIIDKVLCIIDLDMGNMSVTNCIEDVVKEIDYPPEYPVIYRDSDGNWDGFDVTTNKFYSLDTTNRIEAIHKAKLRMLGPTGKFPDGKMNKSDDGELAIAMFIDNNRLILDFNTPTHWIGFRKQDALLLIEKFKEKIKELKDE